MPRRILKTPKRFGQNVKAFSFKCRSVSKIHLIVNFNKAGWQEKYDGGRTPAIRFTLWNNELTLGDRSARRYRKILEETLHKTKKESRTIVLLSTLNH